MFSVRTSPRVPLNTVCGIDLIDQAPRGSRSLSTAPRERSNFLSEDETEKVFCCLKYLFSYVLDGITISSLHQRKVFVRDIC